MNKTTDHKRTLLKELIMQLHAGASPQEVKPRFRQLLEDTSPLEIAKIEQELIKEGVSREEIQKLCDVHMAIFREQLGKQKLNVPVGHPINILMEEHRILLQLTEKLDNIAKKVEQASDISYVADEMHNLGHIAEDLQDSEKHYLREENVLFPIVERHGITEPPAMMWTEHNRIREEKNNFRKLIKNRNTMSFQSFKKQLVKAVESLREILPSHFFKENNILFPAAMRVVTEREWKEARREFDEIGYCCFTPSQSIVRSENEEAELDAEAETLPRGELQFETGTLSKGQLEAMLDTLPVDITFVDKEDTVRYFNKPEKRIFVRTKAVIGRKVHLCHPQKSIHIVKKIVEAFKAGKKDQAEFWIQLNNRLIHIRFFAVRDKNRKFLGIMEVTQDITDIKKIEGERRLLDWRS